MPYKNPEKQKLAVRENARKYMARKRKFEGKTLSTLDSLGIGHLFDFGLMHIEYTKTRKHTKKMLIPVRAGMKLGDSFKASGVPMELKMTKRFYVFGIPLNPDYESEIGRKLTEIENKVEELKKLCEEEKTNE